MNTKLLAPALWGALALATMGAAQAAPIIVTQTHSTLHNLSIAGDFYQPQSASFTFDQFDASLGTLVGVSITASATQTAVAGIEAFFSSGPMETARNRCRREIDDAGGGAPDDIRDAANCMSDALGFEFSSLSTTSSVDFTSADLGLSHVNQIAANIAVDDVACMEQMFLFGESCDVENGVTVSGGVTWNDPSLFTSVIGIGTFDTTALLVYTNIDVAWLVTNGSYNNSQNLIYSLAMADATVSVTYTYESLPGPGALALLGLGLLGLGVRRRTA